MEFRFSLMVIKLLVVPGFRKPLDQEHSPAWAPRRGPVWHPWMSESADVGAVENTGPLYYKDSCVLSTTPGEPWFAGWESL